MSYNIHDIRPPPAPCLPGRNSIVRQSSELCCVCTAQNSHVAAAENYGQQKWVIVGICVIGSYGDQLGYRGLIGGRLIFLDFSQMPCARHEARILQRKSESSGGSAVRLIRGGRRSMHDAVQAGSCHCPSVVFASHPSISLSAPKPPRPLCAGADQRFICPRSLAWILTP